MTRSVFTPKEVAEFTNVSINYANRMTNGTSEVYAAPIWWDAPAMRAAGFLKSTIRDMLRYTEIFRTGGMVGEQRILSAASVDQMVKPHVRVTANSFYGYGLEIHPDYHGLSLVEHSGGLKSISAEMFIAKETGLTGMILNNTGNAPSSEMLSRLVCSIQSLPIETPLYTYDDYDVTADRLPDYAGKYMAFAGMGGVSVAQENGNLVVSIMDGEPLPMRAIARDHFLTILEGSETEVRFFRDSEGHVNAVSVGGLFTVRKWKGARAEQGQF
ncbi:serine hydrolase [Paenibacillus tianmuensis]|nr:serine hydrolase [Paenibacillus tianmuensis]